MWTGGPKSAVGARGEVGEVEGLEFKRRELRAKLSTDEARVLDNFLSRMKKLGVVRPNPEAGPGAYRFANILHYLYFGLEAERARGGAKSR